MPDVELTEARHRGQACQEFICVGDVAPDRGGVSVVLLGDVPGNRLNPLGHVAGEAVHCGLLLEDCLERLRIHRSGALWIEIVEPQVAESGTGSFTFRVTENTGPYRTGSIIVGGEVLVVSQKAPFVEATFEMSNRFPLIGEVVTFSVDPILDVQSWNFGEANCKDPEGSGFINCALLPSGACNTYQWTFPTAGEKDVTMVVTDGRSKTRHPTVQDSGECCLADGRPDASF